MFGYVVLKADIGAQVYKVLSATAYKLHVQFLGNAKEETRDKTDIVYSSLNLEDCLKMCSTYRS